MVLVTRARVMVVGAALVLTGCTALIGVNDIFLDDSAVSGEGGVDGGGRPETGPSGSDGGGDGGTCNADTTSNPDHCGRCGHSCLGGDCKASTCQPVTVLNSAAMPRDFALDDTYAYVTNYYDDTIKRVQKDGGPPTNVVSNWQDLSGIAVSDGKLFWTAEQSSGDGGVPDGGPGNDSFGGVWSCTLPACADKKLLQKLSYGYALFAKDGWVYSASEDGVGRVKTDGTAPAIINKDRVTFAVTADATNVYYVSNYNASRALLDGGTPEDLGPIGDVAGLIAVDDARFLWTYYASDTNGNTGSVNGDLKKVGSRVSYGDKNIGSYGIASDGVNVYWSNIGHYSDQYTPAGDGQLLSCPIAGCGPDGPTVLADKILAAQVVQVDGPAIFFIEFGGTGAKGRLLKVAKP